jgi:hypothetical protein
VAELFEPAKPGERVVVVSPHLDDGALSLGAALHAWAARGARVELLTVLACDPRSDAPAELGRGGFATEGGPHAPAATRISPRARFSASRPSGFPTAASTTSGTPTTRP